MSEEDIKYIKNLEERIESLEVQVSKLQQTVDWLDNKVVYLT
jgi:uncharacterized coiled-coil protein SlyX